MTTKYQLALSIDNIIIDDKSDLKFMMDIENFVKNLLKYKQFYCQGEYQKQIVKESSFEELFNNLHFKSFLNFDKISFAMWGETISQPIILFLHKNDFNDKNKPYFNLCLDGEISDLGVKNCLENYVKKTIDEYKDNKSLSFDNIKTDSTLITPLENIKKNNFNETLLKEIAPPLLDFSESLIKKQNAINVLYGILIAIFCGLSVNIIWKIITKLVFNE